MVIYKVKQKETALFLLIVLLVTFVFSPAALCNQIGHKTKKHNEKKFVSNEVLVRFISEATENERQQIRQSLGAKKIKYIKSIRVEHWKLPKNLSTEEAIEYLQNTPIVNYVEPNYLYKSQTLPNDPQFNKLWYLENIGQSVNGTLCKADADISVTDAWEIETGRHDLIIAVIDTGVAYDHPDLMDNVWINDNEIPNNGIDDDNNGYIDDLHGWDFVHDDNKPSDYSTDLYGDGHGTHVAGTIAAKGNNSLGVTGVMWQASIMPLQIFDLFKTGSFLEGLIQLSNIIKSIEYAVENGAKIINCSFGGGPYSQFQYDIINYANQNGVLIVAAAGNDTNDNDSYPFYPASYDLPNIISVAATNEQDELANYSNYGLSTVDVAAPGGHAWPNANIYSTIPPERVTLFSDDFESGGSKWITSGIYESWSITYDPVFSSNVVQDSTNNYHENETSYLRTANPINAVNCKGLHFQFNIDYSLEDGYDFLYVEGSPDGNTYTTAYYATGFSYGIVSFLDWEDELDLGSFYLRFRLVSDYLYNYDGVYIDNIILTGIPWVFNGNEYDYKSGTSMAAPVVSGIAGLIWSYKPMLNHIEVKNAILNSVDALPLLDGKVLTGGRVNAYKALLSINISPKPIPKAMPWIPLLLLDD